MARMLVIEDTPANRKLISALLEQAGHTVQTASDAETGITLAAEGIDLVLMDIHLPGMDGLAATRILKEDPRTRRIPVLAITALATESDKARILAAGCDGYIAKPIRYKELLSAVTHTLNRKPDNPKENA